MTYARTRYGLVRTAALAALALSCTPAPPPPPPAPTIDAQGLALRLEARGQLQEPTRIFFEWSLSDRDARFRGRGVARLEPPYKARLDLFLASGETAVRAALVGDELRLPPGAPEGLIPPAELLWGTLGVFKPSGDARLRGAEALPDGRTALHYVRPDGIEVRYVVGETGVQQVERLRGGSVVEQLALGAPNGGRYPSEATYRNLTAFRELRLSRQGVEQVEAYPPDIWEVER
jgi:hypothetical protein